MRVGDSALGFFLIHALRRDKRLVLSCGLPSHPLVYLFLLPLGDD